MNILCCGDRNWDNEGRIKEILERYAGQKTTIIHGNCRGADKQAALVGARLGYQLKAFPAMWQIYGKAAGPIRNTQMIVEGKPDLVIAFHDNIGLSKGTKNMIEQARQNNIKVLIIMY